MPKLVTLAHYATQYEADHMASVLKEAGLEASVAGGAAQTTFANVVAGDVRLMVREPQYQAAQEYLRQLQLVGDTQAWYCGACREHVEAGFEVCWSCGKSREQVSAEPPALAALTEPDRPDPGEIAYDPDQRNNPYAAPVSAPRGASRTEPVPAEVIELTNRALRSAIVGCFLFPVVLHFYSMYQLSQAASVEPHADAIEWPRQLQVRWYITLGLNVLATATTLLLFQLLYLG